MEETTLSLLGKKTEYPQDYAPEVLEAFNNKHPEMDYWVRFNCPEFTSLCPITGQPDFATIQIDYIPVSYTHLKPVVIEGTSAPTILVSETKIISDFKRSL